MTGITWLGRGGQGAFTVARLYGSAAVLHNGKKALAFPTFGPERRGAPVFAFTKIANTPIGNRSQLRNPDFVVVLDETLITQLTPARLKINRTIIVNSRKSASELLNTLEKLTQIRMNTGCVLTIPASDIALRTTGSTHANIVLAGYLAQVSDAVTPDALIAQINREFSPLHAERNRAAFNEGFDYGRYR